MLLLLVCCYCTCCSILPSYCYCWDPGSATPLAVGFPSLFASLTVTVGATGALCICIWSCCWCTCISILHLLLLAVIFSICLNCWRFYFICSCCWSAVTVLVVPSYQVTVTFRSWFCNTTCCYFPSLFTSLYSYCWCNWCPMYLHMELLLVYLYFHLHLLLLL